MNKKNRSSPKRSSAPRLGSLGEQLLAAGLTTASNTQGEAKHTAQKQASKRTADEDVSSEAGQEPKAKKRAKSQKKPKQSAKALRRKQARQKKNSLLLGIERQKKRKRMGKVGVSALYDDVPIPVPERASEHRHSVRRVQARLRKTAKTAQAQSGNDASIEFTKSDREKLLDRLSAFEDICPLLCFDEDAEFELVLGFDFGSTSSKLVCRFPYDEGLGAFAIPNVDSLSAEDHPYYWQTLLWEDEVGTFELISGTGKHLHDHLKLAFLRTGIDDSQAITPEMIYVSAYLALMMRQALGWLWLRVGKAIGSKTIGLSVNFGFPTETGGTSPQLDRFQRCARIALRVALSNSAISRTQLEAAFQNEIAGSKVMPVRTLVVPEFIGAVMGYFHSAQKKNGQFMICDIGGLTIDAVCFGFFQASNGDSLIKIYGGAVAPFGAEISKAAVNEGVPKSRLATAIGSFLCDPIKDAHEKTGHNAPAWGGTMPLFVIGGGRHYEGYRGAFSEAERLIKDAWFRTSFRKFELDLNKELDVSNAKGRSCGRLMVAWGLSHSDLDLPEWLTRQELPDGPQLRKLDVEDVFVGKEQT